MKIIAAAVTVAVGCHLTLVASAMSHCKSELMHWYNSVITFLSQ